MTAMQGPKHVTNFERRGTGSLAQFCIAQHAAFAAEEWLARCDHDDAEAEALAAAARYLSMTSWYGYDEQLAQLAERIRHKPANGGLEAEFKSAGFDLPRFAVTVRAGVARSRQGCNRRRGSA